MRAGTRPLKVLYLTPPAPAGTGLAAQSFIEEEIRAIREQDVLPYVLTDSLDPRTMHEGVVVIGTGRRRGPASAPGVALFAARRAAVVSRVLRASPAPRQVAHALRLEQAAAALVRRERIDVVHSHFGWPGGFGGSLAAEAAGVPLITSLRGMDVLVKPDWGYGLRLDAGYDAALRHLIAAADHILTATPFMRDATIALGVHAARVHVLDKGVDTVRFRPCGTRAEIRGALGLRGPVLLAVGGLKRRKGVDVVLEAMRALGRRDTTLLVCGDGEERRGLEQRARELGLRAQVRFEGAIPRAAIARYFTAADVFVHAAELEAAGNVVLEALASGCAAVVTASGGPTEYVEDGVNGFVVPVGDARSLASRVRTLLDDEGLRRRLGEEGRRRVERRHSYPRMVAELRGLYDCYAGAPVAGPRDTFSSFRRRAAHLRPRE